MINWITISLLIFAYLLGSVPSAVWIGTLMHGIDVREHGSGNAGATNTFRVIGKSAGVPVLIFDVLKGFLAVKLVFVTGKYLPGTQQFVNFELALAIAALMGHIFPVFAGFRGGKGIATLFGILCAVHPQAAAICAIIFMITLFTTHYVSLSSLMSALTFPVVTMFVYHEPITSLNIFAMFICVLVFLTHQKNLERLLRGEENKASLFRKRKTA